MICQYHDCAAVASLVLLWKEPTATPQHQLQLSITLPPISDMSKVNYMARATAKANIIALTSNITLQWDANGQYMHVATDHFHQLFTLQLGTCYNNQQPGKGMMKLITDDNNALTTIKSTDHVTADIILFKSKKEVEALSQKTNITKKTKIETHTEAKVKEDDQNCAIKPPSDQKKAPLKPSHPSSGQI